MTTFFTLKSAYTQVRLFDSRMGWSVFVIKIRWWQKFPQNMLLIKIITTTTYNSSRTRHALVFGSIFMDIKGKKGTNNQLDKHPKNRSRSWGDAFPVFATYFSKMSMVDLKIGIYLQFCNRVKLDLSNKWTRIGLGVSVEISPFDETSVWAWRKL